MNRRKFLEVVAATTAAPFAAGAWAAGPGRLEPPKEIVRGEMRYRAMGRTGQEVSIIGLGGHHIGRQKEEKESIGLVGRA